MLASFRNTRPAPAPHQLPPHHELAVLQRDAVLLEEGGHRALPGQRRTTASMVAVSAPARMRLGRLGPLAEQEGQGVDEDRLPRPRLAGEDVQARPEGDGQRLDDREVPDPQLSEHSRPPSETGQRSPHFSLVRSTSK